MAKHNPILGSASVEATELELRNLFAQEVLQSERLRTTILSWTFGGAAIYLTLSMFVVHVVNLPIVEAGFPFAPITIFLTGVTLYEIGARKFVARRLEQGRDVQPWVWYANAFFEVSLPTLMLVFIGQTLGMVLARLSPVVLFYFAFIMLATLRLDFPLSLFTGAVAAFEFAILTAEISKATFGLTPAEYKEHKNLALPSDNLRDHRTDLELIFTMLGEASTTEIARNKNARGLDENRKVSKAGGKIAGDARKALEKKSGRKVVSKQNYKALPEREMRRLRAGTEES